MSDINKVAIVTGASRGIGAAVARRLAGDGYTVIINYAGSVGPAEELAAEIENAGGKALRLSQRNGLAEPHVVCKARAETEVSQEIKPTHARPLVGPKRSL